MHLAQQLIPCDLGTGVDHAKDWICRSIPDILYDKNLFRKTDVDAEVPWLVSQNPALGEPIQVHMMAIGAKHTVGSLHSAYVPAQVADRQAVRGSRREPARGRDLQAAVLLAAELPRVREEPAADAAVGPQLGVLDLPGDAGSPRERGVTAEGVAG